MLREETVEKTYRVLVADDHAVVRHGLRAILEAEPDIEICCEAANGAEAIEFVKKEKPDLIVLDLTMPEKNGLEVARFIRQEAPGTAILILSMHFSEEIARELILCGARGYILKSDAHTELLTAVRHLQQHKPYFTSKLAMTMAASFVRDTPAPTDEEAASPLSARELEVVQLLAAGKSNKEVAAILGVSTRTIESHRNHIMRKMAFGSFSELVRFAIRNKLVEA
jgi:DNA-binding NarL/FixJ family response regulator